MKHLSKASFVTKASGEQHVFSEAKLRKSLLHAGATAKAVDAIVAQIVSRLYDGISTSEIYGMAFRLLKQRKKGPAAKYKLKTAIRELGPTGFPFEHFIARVFQSLGYDTQVSVLIAGKCVRHEVDVVAQKGREQYFIECKFHQQKGNCCDVKVPLYIHSRFNDIVEAISVKSGTALAYNGWVVTNTHFTKDAVAYGLCAGLQLLGWDFPVKDSLKELIDRHRLHPITSLTTLTQSEKQQLLEKDIVLCSELFEHEPLLKNIVHTERLEKVRTECLHLAGTLTSKVR